MTVTPRILGMTLTEAVLVAGGAVWLVYEFLALAVGWPLISPTMRNDGTRWMLWPALFGTLSGHFFGPSVRHPSWTPCILIGLGALILARDLFLRSRLPVESLFPVFLLFVILGAALWGQS